jgi:hypothetical protein
VLDLTLVNTNIGLDVAADERLDLLTGLGLGDNAIGEGQ